MEEGAYERPREKLQRRGAAYLTSVELMQLIIGSGYAKASSGRIARHIVRAIDEGRASYTELLAINGMGSAKVCQVLAALELARRSVAQRHTTQVLSVSAATAIHSMQSSRYKGVECYWYDGAGVFIDKKRYQLSLREHPSVFAKYLFADAMAASARVLVILVSIKQATPIPTTSQLSLIHASRDIAALLSIRIAGIFGVQPDAFQDWTKELL